MSDAANNPSTATSAVVAMVTKAAVCDTLDGGTTAMRDAGKAYLPQWPQENDAAWQARRDSSTLFPAFSRTLDTMVGKPFGEPIVVETSSAIEAHLENVDLCGRDLDSFAREVFRDALKFGISWVLVDFPHTAPAPNLAAERASGARPYWVHVPLGRMIGWRAKNVGGRMVVTQVRFRESVEVDDGLWGVKVEERVRVLEPGLAQVWVKTGETWSLFEEHPVSLTEIPMVPIYTGRTGFWTAEPPLLDLAWKNVEHWQSASDQRNILHVARVPFLAADEDVREDPNAQVTLKAAGILAGFKGLRFVEHTGAAISAGRQDLVDIEDQMRRLAGELLSRTAGDKSAKEAGLEASEGAAWLKAKTRTFQDAIEECLRLHGAWMKDRTPSKATVNCEWDDAGLSAEMFQALTQARQAGVISAETYLENLAEGGMLPDGRTVEDELAALEAEGPKRIAPVPPLPSRMPMEPNSAS